MSPTTTLLIPAIALFIYILLSSIEFGASLFSVFPSLLASEDTVKNYMNPLWETTTIFLAFALISLFSFFPGATPIWTLGLFSLLFGFLLCMGVRVVCILLMHYGTAKSFLLRILYFFSCVASAIVGMLISLYFLTGSAHVPKNIFSAGASLSFFAIITIASSFFRAYTGNKKLTGLVRASGTLFFLLATYFFMYMLAAYPYLSLSLNISAIVPSILIACIILAVVAEMLHEYRLSFFAFALSLGTLFFGFFAAHLPYIVYPSATIADSATNPASLKILEASFGVGIIFIVPALFLLYKLFFFSPKTDSK